MKRIDHIREIVEKYITAIRAICESSCVYASSCVGENWGEDMTREIELSLQMHDEEAGPPPVPHGDICWGDDDES